MYMYCTCTLTIESQTAAENRQVTGILHMETKTREIVILDSLGRVYGFHEHTNLALKFLHDKDSVSVVYKDH